MAAALMLAMAAMGAQAQSSFGSQPVGATTAEQAVTVTFSESSGAVNTVEVLTLGAAGGDFAAGAGASTCSGETITASGSCKEYVSFSPSAPGQRMGAVVLLDGNGNLAGTAYISGTGAGGLGVLAPGNVVVAAGEPGGYTFVGDGLPATQAQLDLPTSVTLDGAGNMYIADSLHHRIRMVCGAATKATIAGTTCTTAGVISTIAGNGKPDYTGDGGSAASATLNSPGGVAVDGAGNLYVADTGNNVVRVISAATGNILTAAGFGSGGALCAGQTDGVGDGCPATEASLNQPWGVTLDTAGNLYIADTFDHRIREVSAATGTITIVAGTGNTTSNGSGDYNGDNIQATAADLNFPYAVAFDQNGNMYIPDSGNERIRMVCGAATKATIAGTTCTTAGIISTIAGSGAEYYNPFCAPPPAPANQVGFLLPEGVAVDAAGNVYIADTQNAGIRKVNAATGDLSTLVQSGCGTTYSNGTFSAVALYAPIGITLDSSGNLYIADYFDMAIREIQSNYIALNYGTTAIRQGSQSTPIDQTVENDGNAALDLTTIIPGANTALDATSTCTTGSPYLPVAADCTVAADFAPAATPTLTGNQNQNGTITTDEDTQSGVAAPNNPLVIQLFGIAQPMLATTTTTVKATPSPGIVSQTITFTATVTGNGGTPTGSVNFIANGNTIGAAALSSGVATFTDSALPAGSYTVTASYLGDAYDAVSTSASISETVELIPTQTDLGTSSTGGTVPQVILVASVLNGATGPMPTGTVTFNNGATALGAAQVNASGVATLQPNLLASTNYNITAVYNGDAFHTPSTSQGVSISGTANDFNVSLSPEAVTLKTTENTTITVSLSSTGGFTDTIGLGCASLPVGVTCHFSPISVNLPANGMASAQLTMDTNNPLSGGASAMNRRPGGGAQLAGLFLPFSVFFGWLFWRQRRRSFGVVTMALVMVLSAAALLATGCSGYSANSAAPGTYTIQVMGAGTNSDLSHYQNLTLTITQ